MKEEMDKTKRAIVLMMIQCFSKCTFVCVSQEEMKSEMTSLKKELVSEVATSTCMN